MAVGTAGLAVGDDVNATIRNALQPAVRRTTPPEVLVVWRQLPP
jgi:hypothetical protein